ncbi:MAG: molybdopterin-dependent oxidoreductase [Leptospiraceae bacterium]|nr:molybdopterin-dependent oxidoreductase [Leptospiraceae bacterium]MCP5493226.1 molybdopterin-dependent oxidoreductase [Leptospiraceae bacterium]
MTSYKAVSSCILCDNNCGIEIQVENREFKSFKGHKAHPASEGYVCQKPGRLNYYQNHSLRLTSPLKKQSDGSFQEISWDQAIEEIAEKLLEIRGTHTGKALAYYGGGGQGNHLQGMHGSFLRKAMGTRYVYSSLAQEKTGDFWVMGKLFGGQDVHATADQIKHADLVVFIGTNPWMAHGFPQSRNVLKDIQNDPNRQMVVIDPKRTKTAEMADLHISVKPGQDAYLLAALLSILTRNNYVDMDFIQSKTVGWTELEAVLRNIPISDFCKQAGVEPNALQDLANRIHKAKNVVVRHDLGLEQSLHTTLNSYLEKLLWILTGNFGRQGTVVLHTSPAPLIGHSEPDENGDYSWKTAVTGMFPISGIYPPNVLPLEIDTDHPGRIRGLIVDSSNPLVTAADSKAYFKAFSKLELLVTIDTAFTETARLSHYVLPASSQFEKWEASFFNFGFPENHFHLRKPILEPLPNTLTESEIYNRLVSAMGEKPTQPLQKFQDKLDEPGRLVLSPLYLLIRRYASVHSEAVMRAGIKPKQGQTLGDALFEKILEGPTTISIHEYSDLWSGYFMKHKDKKIHLYIPEMIESLKELSDDLNKENNGKEYPFILMAGERRSYNANHIIRNPEWRKSDKNGALHIHPEDAQKYGLIDGKKAVCETPFGKAEVTIEYVDSASLGFISLPHGYGMSYAEKGLNLKNMEETNQATPGVRVNMLTGISHCDPFSKTPYHKYIPAKLIPI